MASLSRMVLRVASIRQMNLQHVDAKLVTYRGRRAIRLQESHHEGGDVQSIAVLPCPGFTDGSIEISLVGIPRRGAPGFARGFVGIAFHVQPDASRLEAFFLRPTNSRAEDQLRRNHSTQYMSHPDYPWFRLREESPGVYESYVDLPLGAWTPVKIVVDGSRASLFVSGATQPCLIVNDLKWGRVAGQIALWVGSGTLAYFSTRLVLRRAP